MRSLLRHVDGWMPYSVILKESRYSQCHSKAHGRRANHNNQVFSLKFEPEEHKEMTPNATPFQKALVCLPAQGEG